MTIQAKISKSLPQVGDTRNFTLDIDLEAEAGITVLLGPSGAGKTLTLNCLAGFATPQKGRILVNEQIHFDAVARVNLPPERRRCGYLFQEDALFPHMTIRGNLRFGAKVAKAGSLATRKRIQELLEDFELTGLADRRPVQLSGGEKQRASLARTLISDPQFILLDEPARGLDIRLRESFYAILRETQRRAQIPMLLVTHDLEECFALADQICLMDRGSFVQTGSPAGILAKPASLQAANLLGLHAVLPAEIVALDPARNTSQLRIFDQMIAGRYLPGQLLGDRGHLCVPMFDVRADVPSNRPGELVLEKRNVAPALGGMRVQLQGGVALTIPLGEYAALQSQQHVAVSLPPQAMSFISG